VVAVVDEAVVAFGFVVVGLEVEQVLVGGAHVVLGGGVFQVVLDGLGSEVFDAVDAVAELALDAEHLDGAEVLLEHLAFGVEEAYLFADEATDDEARFDT